MKTHTTNYLNTFIEVAEDCPISQSQIPPEKNEKTIASLQYDLLKTKPYHYSSDDVIFECFKIKNEITKEETAHEREKFFSKGQPCFRSSSLAKRYGFGFHHNSEGKVAIFPVESKNYKDLMEDSSVTKVKAMRSKRK